MKKATLIFALLLSPILQAQSVLFIGTYYEKATTEGYWCRDRELEKKVIDSYEEASQYEKDFKAAHVEDTPEVKIIENRRVIIYEFQKPVPGFSCTVRAIGYTEVRNGSNINIQEMLHAERLRIRKESKTEIKEIFDWTASENTIKVTKTTVDGIEIEFKVYENINTKKFTTMAIAKNPKENSNAAEIMYISNELSDTNATKIEQPSSKPIAQVLRLEPGETSIVSLRQAKNIDVKLKLVPKGPEPETSVINWIVQKIRLHFVPENGSIKKDTYKGTPPATVRG